MDIYACDISSDELRHYGIKGMKWGVRRFQDKSGKLTAAGKKRYDDDNSTVAKKSKHRTKLEEKYRQQGMSKEEAEKAANDRIRTERALVAVSALTVAAAAAYVANKHLKVKADGIIRAGDQLQRVEYSKEGKLHDAFYSANNKADKTKYAGHLGYTRKQQAGEAYLMKIGVKKDVKIAGQDTAVAKFKHLYENDSEFRQAAKKHVDTNIHGFNAADGDYKKMYENFNSALIDRDNVAVKKFYKALKDDGYGAVRDVNDMKFSQYKAKNPLIVFGQKDNVMVESFEKMTDSEIGKNLIKDGARETAKQMTVYGAATVYTTATVSAASMYIEDHSRDEASKTRRH